MIFAFIRFHRIISYVSCNPDQRLTLEQLAIFIAVAEREHLTQGAAAIGLTPSAASAAIRTLEAAYGVRLFDRVGRRIELTRAGMQFLHEARATLGQVRAAELLLSELGELKTGRLDLHASQTVGNYWLPARMLAFAQLHPGIALNLDIGNTAGVAAAVLSGAAELGFIEGDIDNDALAVAPVGADRLVVVVPPDPAVAAAPVTAADLEARRWVMREAGSGTRAAFEAALAAIGIAAAGLEIRLTLPSNEAVLNAVRSGGGAAALSEIVAEPFIRSGQLARLPLELPPRRFTLLRHRERRPSAAARRFEALCLGAAQITPG